MGILIVSTAENNKDYKRDHPSKVFSVGLNTTIQVCVSITRILQGTFNFMRTGKGAVFSLPYSQVLVQ